MISLKLPFPATAKPNFALKWNGLFKKKNRGGGSWGHGISRDNEERACENSTGQLKKWDSQGYSRMRKTHAEFSWVLVFEFQRGVSSLLSFVFPRLKSQI